jgi:DNA (cytosine-5)-methyltransferase 1
MSKYVSVDLFSGCGGLSEGMRQAGFDVRVAVEINKDAALTYKMNHPATEVLQMDIRRIEPRTIKELLGDAPLHLLAGCPPCQGFSSVRKLHRKHSIRDERNKLVTEYFRFVEELKPLTIMMEIVPGIVNYYLFRDLVKKLKKLGYAIKLNIVNVKDYGVPQRRRRLVMVGSVLGQIDIAQPTNERTTVREAIGRMETIDQTNDQLHRIIAKHTERINKMISMIPKNGGGRKDLPEEYRLKCHNKDNVGFDDIYGRLRWDDYSNTITAGCLNPSKGRFLHPEENRVITPREAALIQTFPLDYKFPTRISKTSLANMIGEALPPKFSYIQCNNIKEHLDSFCG